MLICLGLLFQGDRLNLFVWWRARDLWPTLLIAAGLGILFGRMHPPAGTQASGLKPESGEYVNAYVALGGLERKVTSKQFRGGDVTAVLGGMQLDLRQADLAPGDQNLHLNAILGGIKLRVPETWVVSVEGTPLIGAVEDNRSDRPSADSASAGRLRVRGLAVMGSIEVKT